MNKKDKERIELIGDELMVTIRDYYRDCFGGLGNSIAIFAGCKYDADKSRLFKKKKWDKDCDKWIKEAKKAIKQTTR